MKATDLQQTIRFFDPRRPLTTAEELESWYLERPHSPLRRLKLLLETSDEPKILFTGQRGSGKTTELNRLVMELEPRFQTHRVDALEILGSDSQLSQKMHGFISNLESAVGNIEADLVLVEGLDRVDRESARHIFLDHASKITAPNVAMIYVCPLIVRQAADFSIRQRSPVVFLPNMPLRLPEGEVREDGYKVLRRLLLARLDEALIEPDAIRHLVLASGGLPSWLAVLVRSAALYALERGAARIAYRDVEAAVRDLRRDLLVSLDREDQQVLRERHADHRLTADPEEMRLFDHGSLIEYPGDVPWCDAHPALWPLLEEDGDRLANDREVDREPAAAVPAPSPVYVRSLEIHSVKGVHHARFDLAETLSEAPGWYVLAGGNGAGKSTLLRSLAIAMLGRLAGRFVDGSWIERDQDTAEVGVTLLTGGGSEPDPESRISIQADGALHAERDDATEDLLRNACYFAGYGPFKRLEGGSDHARDLARNDARIGQVITLFLEEAALWEIPKWLFRAGQNRKQLVRSLLSLINSGLLPEGFRAERILDEDLILSTPDGPEIPLRMTSDGPRCMVTMVLDILRGLEVSHGGLLLEDNRVLNPGIILIDEPDNHLHIHWQLKLGSWMKQCFPKVQFLVATHSPFLCAAADKIWRLDDENGHIAPRVLPEEEMRQLRNGSISAILESDAFRIFNTLPAEARERHMEFLELRRLSLQGKRLSATERTRLSELEQEFLGASAPPDPAFDALFS